MRTVLLATMAAMAMAAGPRPAVAGELEAGRLDDVVALCLAAERALTTGVADQQSIFDAGACNGFIYGVLTGRYEGYDTPAPGWFCEPDSFTTAEVVIIFNDYIRAHPDWRDSSGGNPAAALEAAIREAWPCS